MIRNTKTQVTAAILRETFSVLLAALLLTTPLLRAQTPPTHFVGTITAISGNTVTVKTDVDGDRQFEVPSTTVIKRISPGQRDLSNADTLQFSDLAPEDRVLVKLDPAVTTTPAQALQIIAVKQADLVKKQQEEREDWQKRGVGGLVKSVDPATDVVLLASGAGSKAKTIVVHITKTTILKRYAPNSVSFDAAKPAPIDAIHPGDQLRARGAKNEVGNEITAEEVVSGTFRNISGTVLSINATAQTLVVKDLATKKPVTIHMGADVQMRKLPEHMAQALAERLKGGTNGPGGKGGHGSAQGAASPAGSHGGQGADPQQILNRAPVIQLSDLKKGDAVMVVSTDGTTDVTAITLVAGVEPLLESPEATQRLLSNWSMGSSGQEIAPE